jgi:uncharacterized protein YmfQ (DUF2313 family)
MARTATEYLNLLKSLLPKGKAWTREVTSILHQFLFGEADELARVDARSDVLLSERDSRTVNELLPEYEEELGLPDDCSEAAETIEERRRAVNTKVLSLGGQHPQYYIDLALAVGSVIKIIEYITPRFHFSIVTDGRTIVEFICGSSESGDPLTFIPPAVYLECIINRLKPAHTVANFVYSNYAFDENFGPGFDSLYKKDTDYMEGAFNKEFNLEYDVRYGGAFGMKEWGYGPEFDNSFDRMMVRTPDVYYGGSFGPAYASSFKQPEALSV